jgi:hypothetical protein
MECEGLTDEQLKIVMEFAELVEKEFWSPLLDIVSKNGSKSSREIRVMAKKLFEEVIIIEKEDVGGV